ncbi:MAG TPA: response regulator [Ignavibacteria bacterium]|nr:response regulator [Ignavibacteria bacterium]
MKNILIVEDNQLIIDFYKIILKRAGYNPIILEDSDKVLKLLATEKVSLIIMDINLSNCYLSGEKIDGIKFSNHIKHDKRFYHIPLIIVSAYTPDILEGRVDNNYKPDCFLTKPILDFNILINKINQLVLN